MCFSWAPASSFFSPAITVRLTEDTRGFTEADFRPLADHYTELTRQVQYHVPLWRAGAGRHRSRRRSSSSDYFTMETRPFVSRWLPDMKLPRDGASGPPRALCADRRRPEGARPDRHRLRRPAGIERAGARWPRLRQDAGPGPSHRLSPVGQARGPLRHPGAGLQPARRPRDPYAASRACRRHGARGDGADLPRAGALADGAEPEGRTPEG